MVLHEEGPVVGVVTKKKRKCQQYIASNLQLLLTCTISPCSSLDNSLRCAVSLVTWSSNISSSLEKQLRLKLVTYSSSYAYLLGGSLDCDDTSAPFSVLHPCSTIAGGTKSILSPTDCPGTLS